MEAITKIKETTGKEIEVAEGNNIKSSMQKQFQIYSLDIKSFYTDKESEYHKLAGKANGEIRIVKEHLLYTKVQKKYWEEFNDIDVEKLKGEDLVIYKAKKRDKHFMIEFDADMSYEIYVKRLQRCEELRRLLKVKKKVEVVEEVNTDIDSEESDEIELLIEEENLQIDLSTDDSFEEDEKEEESKDNMELTKEHRKLKRYFYIVKYILKQNKEMFNDKDFKNEVAENEVVIDLKKINKDNKELLKEELKKNKTLTRILNSLKIENKKTGFQRSPISLFDSYLSRCLELEMDKISKDIIVITFTYYSAMEQLIKNNFIYEGNEYCFFSCSAGQIRNKCSVFMKKTVHDAKINQLTNGLPREEINKSGGANPNKWMSYTALASSASSKIENFDINKAIVVDDFKTNVKGAVDLINNVTFKVKRRPNYSVSIEHSDGCGMVLSSESKENYMIRLPGFKGLMTPVPYLDYCKDKNNDDYKIKDIYGKAWDLKADDIRYIFSKSQFKMHSYYKNEFNEDGSIKKYGWDVYKENFIKYECHASECNRDSLNAKDYKDASYNYQMLQSLSKMTDDEIAALTHRTETIIKNAYTNKNVMLEILGVTKANSNKTNLQKCLEIYPELINDYHVQEELKSSINSKKKKAKFGKVKINARYTFLLPDTYAWLQFLFSKEKDKANDKSIVGLLKDGECYCKLYDADREVVLDRSPHLYREHKLTMNIADTEDTKKYFCTNGVYTSCKDLVSKLLQFDNDGDRALICGDSTIVECVRRHMKKIVPLYYKMGKAGAVQLTDETIVESLKLAYKYGNIGEYSNRLTKLWNTNYPDGKLNTIKVITAISNYSIDASKTLEFKSPVAGSAIDLEVKEVENLKLPYFFKYAKDKPVEKLAPINNSTVNRICAKIEGMPQYEYDFSKVGNFDYKMLMNNPKIKVNKDVIVKYHELDESKNHKFLLSELPKEDIYVGVYNGIKKELIEAFREMKIEDIVDMIVKHIYQKHKTTKKSFLFNSFGDIIYKNILKNDKMPLGDKWSSCSVCGERYEKKSNRQTMCAECAKKVKAENDAKRKKESRLKAKKLKVNNK